MNRLLLAVFVAVSVSGQGLPPAPPKPHVRILSDSRSHNILGDFSVKYTQEDGTTYDEVSKADGTRVGSYSYFDDAGKKHVVNYEAGKGGFRILKPQGAQPGPQGRPLVPNQQYPPSHPIWHQGAKPAAPKPQQYIPPAPQAPKQAAPAPFSYTVNTGNNAASVSFNPVAVPQPAPQPAPAPAPIVPSIFPGVNPQPAAAPVPQQPTRFFPPGNLQLQRTHQGFAYSFSS